MPTSCPLCRAGKPHSTCQEIEQPIKVVRILIAVALIALVSACEPSVEIPGSFCDDHGEIARTERGAPLVCTNPDGKEWRWYFAS